MNKTYTTGTWKITHEDGKESLIDIKNQAQARLITDNMPVLRIKGWEVEEV